MDKFNHEISTCWIGLYVVCKIYIHILNRILDLTWPKWMKLTMEQQYMLSVLHNTTNTMPADALATLVAAFTNMD